jgi:N6-L-threonylcarbamoyladenine synthase
MKIVAIETSCDDTAVAIIEGKNKKIRILSDIVSSQVKLHAKYGGVYPFLAKREHQKNLPLVFKQAMEKAGNPKLDAIAVTYGPGLEPCLWQGINFANDFTQKLKAPLFPANHVEAHLLANFIEQSPTSLKFPAIGLVVSGGHTQLILIKRFLSYEVLGETRDDAAGECFDKVARIMGLGYPGGPIIAQLAQSAQNNTTIDLPRPMIGQKNYDFSFSGLKTAVLYEFRKQTPKTQKDKQYIQAMCQEVQQAIVDVLIYKTLKAAKDYRIKSIILGGGVTANQELRKQFQERIKKEVPKTRLYLPDPKFCTDNAAMVAATAYFHLQKSKKTKKQIEAQADLRL